MTVTVKPYKRVRDGNIQEVQGHVRSDHSSGYKQLTKREVDMNAIRARRKALGTTYMGVHSSPSYKASRRRRKAKK